MHKVKEMFGKKDDNTHTNAATGDNVEPERRRSSIMRQIMNPGGNKYDETIHGTTATATPGVANTEALQLDPDVVLRTDTAEKNEEKKTEHGVLRQIMNPNGDKYDNEGYGTTAHAVGETGASTAQTTSPDAIQRA